MEAYDRIASSDCSDHSCNNANSWLRIRTNVRRNIHEKCASGRPALFVKTSVNSFVAAPRQRWCSIPFMIPSASQFKEKPPSQNGFFTLGHCCSSPWLIAQCPLSCGLSSFYSPFSLVLRSGSTRRWWEGSDRFAETPPILGSLLVLGPISRCSCRVPTFHCPFFNMITDFTIYVRRSVKP